ncbi:hypothetical protein HU200_066274 [Digitaria exilis]|uniref:Uncharacterized protein n=1 Tax=Digitaria exilis TaxID=1010633 RepID=A0A835A6T5_9POAL|nr:hypothetical protein HU200_066274 [Digitaria exilis]
MHSMAVVPACIILVVMSCTLTSTYGLVDEEPTCIHGSIFCTEKRCMKKCQAKFGDKVVRSNCVTAKFIQMCCCYLGNLPVQPPSPTQPSVVTAFRHA